MDELISHLLNNELSEEEKRQLWKEHEAIEVIKKNFDLDMAGDDGANCSYTLVDKHPDGYRPTGDYDVLAKVFHDKKEK